MSDSVYVIAEAGVNHNGSADMAFELVEAAADAGANAVKFQTFKAVNLVTKTAKKAEYQKKTSSADETQYDMLKRLELGYELHFELSEQCRKRGIDFLSTAFDFESLEFLVGELGLSRLKLPSGEITNAPLVLEHARKGCDLIVSTGMATLGEIESALGVIAFGLVAESNASPSIAAFNEAYFSREGREALARKVTLLHCTTEYPAPPEDINLNVLNTLRNAFGLQVGYSDHSEGIAIPIAAAACGAVLLEKHFTLDKNLEGPDHKASLEPTELQQMVSSIRVVEQAMGLGIKGPMPSEIKNKAAARKSLVAACDIKKGDVFSESNLSIKRPGSGISPMLYWETLGNVSPVDIKAGELISG